MSELRTEEEQLEAIKSWWKENGKSTLFGIALAVVVVMGWRGWQANVQAEAENASIVYQNMLQAVLVAENSEGEEAKTAVHLAGTLKSDYESSGYARYAALWLAKQAVGENDLPRAVEELNWVLAHKPEAPVEAVTRLRLARVLTAQGEYDQALAQVALVKSDSFVASANEAKGDIYLAKGDAEQARDAYQAAQLATAAAGERPILKMKLDDLAQAGDK